MIQTLLKNTGKKLSGLLTKAYRILINLLLRIILGIFGRQLVKNRLKHITVEEWFDDDSDIFRLFRFEFLKKLARDSNYSVEYVREVWHTVNDEWLKLCGVSDNRKAIFKLKRKVVMLISKRIETKRRYIDNEINILLIDLKRLEDQPSASIEKMLNDMEKIFPIRCSNDMNMYDFGRRLKGLNNG